MGYDYFKGYTREQAKKRVLKDWKTDQITTETLQYRESGDILWILRSTKTFDKSQLVWIECVILDSSNYGWGYKRLCEEEHPYYYDCPIEWLALAPLACANWRVEVIVQYATSVLQQKEKGQ